MSKAVDICQRIGYISFWKDENLMKKRLKHPNKEIEVAIAYAE